MVLFIVLVLIPLTLIMLIFIMLVLILFIRTLLIPSIGPVAEGFGRRTLASKFGTSPKSHHVDDAGSSSVGTEIFTGHPAAKVHAVSYTHLTLPTTRMV